VLKNRKGSAMRIEELRCPKCGCPPKPSALMGKDDILTCYPHGHTLEPPRKPEPETSPRIPRTTSLTRETILEKKLRASEILDKWKTYKLPMSVLAKEAGVSEESVYIMRRGYGHIENYNKLEEALTRLESTPGAIRKLQVNKRRSTNFFGKSE
jgi:hypothetical protein